jgi:hypothetical protein
LLLQVLQLFTSELRLISQPLARLPSQLPKPLLHAMPQFPPLQVAVPLVPLQTVLQRPQWVGSPFVLISQPFAGLPSQSAKPGLQFWIAQTPLLQVAVAFGSVHDVVHLPQCCTSIIRFDSQPSRTVALQSAWPAAQLLMLHAPPAQAPVPLGGAHGLAQPPQFCRLVARSISQPSEATLLQSPKPDVHVTVQVPFPHEAAPFVELQMLPQVPQFEASLVRRASQPSEYLLLQSAKPVEQPLTPQTELTHVPRAPLATAQELRQLPQLSGSVVVLASHPFFTSPSQLP